ncbi:hypothetical protein Srubr_31480 [Streptomyces rubradiris]|uniref:Uncharacterized protein n=1 Tax=Streptomyces rubradiris TaxID=285531 RepID=A0ABQ3RBR5_STRRR|nr:hypothetical protein GCM10018792_00410 [Streptomyces rubradiris]GHI53302.1 hypothetical protein Srubr_31480 [Streptomyces rubradiris]
MAASRIAWLRSCGSSPGSGPDTGGGSLGSGTGAGGGSALLGADSGCGSECSGRPEADAGRGSG